MRKQQILHSQAAPDILSVAKTISARHTWLYRQITCLRRHVIHTFVQKHANAKEYPLEHITVCRMFSGRIIRKGMRAMGLLRWADKLMSRRLRQLLKCSDFRVLQAHFGPVAAQ